MGVDVGMMTLAAGEGTPRRPLFLENVSFRMRPVGFLKLRSLGFEIGNTLFDHFGILVFSYHFKSAFQADE
jgi:hypothetical protein